VIVSGPALIVLKAAKLGSEVIKNVAAVVAVVNFVIALLSSVALSNLFSFCNIMQIFVLVALLNVPLTAPLGVFFGYLT